MTQGSHTPLLLRTYARHHLFSAPTSSWISLIFPSLPLCVLCYFSPLCTFWSIFFDGSGVRDHYVFSHLWCCYHYHAPFLFCDICLLVCLVKLLLFMFDLSNSYLTHQTPLTVVLPPILSLSAHPLHSCLTVIHRIYVLMNKRRARSKSWCNATVLHKTHTFLHSIGVCARWWDGLFSLLPIHTRFCKLSEWGRSLFILLLWVRRHLAQWTPGCLLTNLHHILDVLAQTFKHWLSSTVTIRWSYPLQPIFEKEWHISFHRLLLHDQTSSVHFSEQSLESLVLTLYVDNRPSKSLLSREIATQTETNCSSPEDCSESNVQLWQSHSRIAKHWKSHIVHIHDYVIAVNRQRIDVFSASCSLCVFSKTIWRWRSKLVHRLV